MLGKQEIKSILELRLVLETLALELAIPRITDADIEIIKGHLERFYSAQDPHTAAESAFCFHHEIGILSGNTLLPLIFYSFKAPVSMLWRRYIQLHGKEKLYENILALYRQMEQRDVAQAVQVLKEAINQTISGVFPFIMSRGNTTS